MTDEQSRKPWGTGRVAFVARLDTIRSEIGQGLTLTAIYDRHKAALGIGYSAFCKMVTRHADDSKPLRRRSAAAAEPLSPQVAPTRELPPKPAIPAPAQGATYAGHEPAPPRTFAFDGNPREDDEARLIGGPARKPKG